MNAEQRRLEEARTRGANWKRWGPYLSERQWGTVREDYSPSGECWSYLPHDHARSRAYRWGEEGILGFTDRECRLCFALAFWNGRDPIIKERLFGLVNSEGNHGEDVKECYFYLDSTPTHSYTKGLYKYPQAAFPYGELIERNRHLGKLDPEFELTDTGVFDDDRYFDIFVEYAKASANDILIRIRIVNRGPESADLHLLPHLWFRNTWTWGCTHEGCTMKPRIERKSDGALHTRHETLEPFVFRFEGSPDLLFTDNETNLKRLYGVDNHGDFVKDAIDRAVVHGESGALNPKPYGTKVALQYQYTLGPGEERVVCMRLTAESELTNPPFGDAFDKPFLARLAEADEFYASVIGSTASRDERQILRQGYAGLLWSKQFYHYIVEDWLKGDPSEPPPPGERFHGRNHDWGHVFSRDILSMPDKWEYPWFAAWDLAFHMIPFAEVDPDFAKEQLQLLLREWYMHPNGQIPAYEFAFSDVNPPVHAWACWRVYKMTAPRGERDRAFLERVFQKLLLNFTWWVNRKDPSGHHLFSGGFLGLDNIGVFDRSQPLPGGGELEQADGTAWMAFYCATMLSMALELALDNPAYEDIASKFFEHFVAITDAINSLGGTGLWDDEDGFYYDQMRIDGRTFPLKLRTIVGVIPMFAVELLPDGIIDKLPGFKKRMLWYLKNRKDLAQHISYVKRASSEGERIGVGLLAIPSKERLVRVLRYVLDEREFLSPHGVRSLSRAYEHEPYVLRMNGNEYRVDYTPGESTTWMFGGNSNWRGPIWFPLNYLLIEALERYHHFYGEEFKVECPTGSGIYKTLEQVSCELSRRLFSIFEPDEDGHRPANGRDPRFADDPNWSDYVLFYEYFHGNNGRGIGASHQTGWTALVTRLSPCRFSAIIATSTEMAPRVRVPKKVPAKTRK